MYNLSGELMTKAITKSSLKNYITKLTGNSIIRLLIDIKEFILLIIFLITISGIPFSKPELEVEYENVALFPSVLADEFASTFNFDIPVIDKLKKYLNSEGLLIIRIANNSKKSIK